MYTVNGSDGENLDAKASKPEKKKTLDSLFAEQEAAEAAANEQAPVEEKAEKEKPLRLKHRLPRTLSPRLKVLPQKRRLTHRY